MRKKVFRLVAIFCAFSFIASTAVSSQSASITGTVKDPAGAVIQGAQVALRNEATGESRTATTDDQGRFKFDRLAPGRYTLSFSRTGFKTAERSVSVEGSRAEAIEISLEVAAPDVKVDVTSKGGVAPNSEPNYRALRDAQKFESYAVNNLTIKRDTGTVLLRSGRISFLPAVMNRVVKAVFIGDGEFSLTPQIRLEQYYLRLVTEKDSVVEQFNRAVFCFTDGTYEEIKHQTQPASDAAGAADTLKDFNDRVRFRTERPISFLQAILSDAENIDAEILTDIYNPKRPGFFSAYLFGKSMSDLRYHVRPRSALPQFLAPEEVTLINLDPGGEKDAILYLAHLQSEYQSGKASSDEDKRLIDAQHYRMETVIDNGEKLTAQAEITFTPVSDSERVISFGLLPNLRVTRATFGGQDINFIQEKRKQDATAYVIFPQPLVRGQQYKLTMEYQGEK
ncbi:MAG TPA: carboxypeptidase-like regulatory domain-containing protein, partial [Blastocatellia bacterium]